MAKKKIQKSNTPPQVTRTTVEQISVSLGPLPPPDILAGYEKVCPGAADRIIKMAEKQMEHRHMLETKRVNANILHEKMGIIAGFTIAIVGLVSATFMVVKGAQWAGTIMGAIDLVSLVGVFIYGTRKVPAKVKEKDSGKTQA